MWSEFSYRDGTMERIYTVELDCLEVQEVDFFKLERTQKGLMTVQEREKHNTVRWEGPQYGTYNTHAARLRSYDNWPCAVKQKPVSLSEAGLFFTGKSL
jgi:hypothetical protein